MTKQQFVVGCAVGMATGLVLLGLGVPKSIASVAGGVMALVATQGVSNGRR